MGHSEENVSTDLANKLKVSCNGSAGPRCKTAKYLIHHFEHDDHPQIQPDETIRNLVNSMNGK